MPQTATTKGLPAALRNDEGQVAGGHRVGEDYRGAARQALARLLEGRMFGQAFSGADDALIGFVTTGKLEIKGLADNQGSVSPVTGPRHTTTLMLPPCSRSGSKAALQAAHRPRLGTLENQLFSTI